MDPRELQLQRNQAILNNIEGLSKEEFDKAFPIEQYEHYSANDLREFVKAVEDELKSGRGDKDLFEKAMKNLGKLVKKVITDKNGKKQTVWVKPAGSDTVEHTFNPNGVIQKINDYKDKAEKGVALQKVAQNYDKLSHINKIRFEKEYQQHFKKPFKAGGDEGDVKADMGFHGVIAKQKHGSKAVDKVLKKVGDKKEPEKKGGVEEVGELKNGKREGKWIRREDGKTVAVAIFKDGKIQTGHWPNEGKDAPVKRKPTKEEQDDIFGERHEGKGEVVDGSLKVNMGGGSEKYITKIDSTHFFISDKPGGGTKTMAQHIAQHKDEPYYDEVRAFLNKEPEKKEEKGKIIPSKLGDRKEEDGKIIPSKIRGKVLSSKEMRDYLLENSGRDWEDKASEIADKYLTEEEIDDLGGTSEGSLKSMINGFIKVVVNSDKYKKAIGDKTPEKKEPSTEDQIKTLEKQLGRMSGKSDTGSSKNREKMRDLKTKIAKLKNSSEGGGKPPKGSEKEVDVKAKVGTEFEIPSSFRVFDNNFTPGTYRITKNKYGSWVAQSGRDVVTFKDSEFKEFMKNGKFKAVEKSETDEITMVDKIDILKAKDLSKLVKKQITNKLGKKTTVWVRAGEEPTKDKSSKKVEEIDGKSSKTEGGGSVKDKLDGWLRDFGKTSEDISGVDLNNDKIKLKMKDGTDLNIDRSKLTPETKKELIDHFHEEHGAGDKTDSSGGSKKPPSDKNKTDQGQEDSGGGKKPDKKEVKKKVTDYIDKYASLMEEEGDEAATNKINSLLEHFNIGEENGGEYVDDFADVITELMKKPLDEVSKFLDLAEKKVGGESSEKDAKFERDLLFDAGMSMINKDTGKLHPTGWASDVERVKKHLETGDKMYGFTKKEVEKGLKKISSEIDKARSMKNLSDKGKEAVSKLEGFKKEFENYYKEIHNKPVKKSQVDTLSKADKIIALKADFIGLEEE